MHAHTRCGSVGTRIESGPAGERFAVTPHQGPIRSRDRRGLPGLDSGVPRGYAATSRCPHHSRTPADRSHSRVNLTGRTLQTCSGSARTTQQRPGRKRLGSKDFGQHPFVPGLSPSLVREDPRAPRGTRLYSALQTASFRLACSETRGVAGEERVAADRQAGNTENPHRCRA